MYLVEHRYFTENQWTEYSYSKLSSFLMWGSCQGAQRPGGFKQIFAALDPGQRRTGRMNLT